MVDLGKLSKDIQKGMSKVETLHQFTKVPFRKRIKDTSYTDPMTIYDAKRKLKWLRDKGAVIYELKPIKTT